MQKMPQLKKKLLGHSHKHQLQNIQIPWVRFNHACKQSLKGKLQNINESNRNTHAHAELHGSCWEK